MSAWVGQHLRVDRVVCIAPFFGVGWLPNPLAALAGRVALAVPNCTCGGIRSSANGTDPRTRIRDFRRTPSDARSLFASRLLAIAVDEAPATRRIAFVTNDAEATVDNFGVLRLAAAWRRHPGVAVEVHRLTGLRRSHDIIEPKRRRR